MSVPDTIDDNDGNDNARNDADAVGERLKAIRTSRGMTLRGLGERCGLSAGFLSQLERGLTSASLTSLRELAAALDVPVAELLDDPPTVPARAARHDVVLTITRASSGPPAVLHSGARTYQMLSSRTNGLVLEPLIAQFAPGEHSTPLEAHEGEEFAYVLDGELTYVIGDDEYVLSAGDSIHLRSNAPHAICNRSDRVVTVLSVLTPRLF